MNDLYQNINCTGMMKEECTAWYLDSEMTEEDIHACARSNYNINLYTMMFLFSLFF